MARSQLYLGVKRVFDVISVLLASPVVVPLALVVALSVKMTSPGPIIYWSDRVGAGGRVFRMPKFRTMRHGTPALATHLLEDSRSVVTSVGGFLRKSSLDEIPQLWSILKGDMTLVGPRPALFNQDDLIALRQEQGVDSLVPGLTGWAQVNGRDDLPIPEKVAFDREYLDHLGVAMDCRIIALTAMKVLRGSGVRH